MKTPHSTRILTVLFADIAGSTRLYDTLGNDAAKVLIDRGLAALEEATLEEGGELIKTMGDEVLCAFSEVDAAARAAVRMHRSLSSIPSATPLVAYVGFHRGEVIRDSGGDIFGDAVNVAARVIKLGRPRQTLTTASTLAGLSAELRETARLVDRASFKGKHEEMEIHELVWESDSVTFMPPSSDGIALRLPRACLELTVRGESQELGAGRSQATLGRLDHNDVVVPCPCTSRTHARIESRGGQFVLVDQSSNGTYLEGMDGKVRRLLREEAQLKGEGLIGLGAPPSKGEVEPVRFRILQPGPCGSPDTEGGEG